MNFKTHKINIFILIFKNRNFLLVLFYIFFSSGCAYFNYFYNAKKYFEQGERQQREQTTSYQSKRSGSTPFDKCIESAGKMLLYYPGSKWEDDALLLIAKAYYNTGKYRSAVVKVDELEAKYPQSKFIQEARLWKGASLIKLAQPDSARQLLSQLFNESTKNDLRAQAYYILAEYYYSEKQWNSAIEYYRQASKIVTDNWLKGQAWIKLAECYMLQKQFDDAIEFYNEILAQKIPRRLRFEASIKRAVVIREAGHPKESIENLKKLLKEKAFADAFPIVELEIGRGLIAMGMKEEARQQLEHLAQTEKRGDIAAQVQFELGHLLWSGWRDYSAASLALKEVKNADRSSSVATAADSLLNEIETLTKYYQKLVFLERQIQIIDSARSGLRTITKNDTISIDTSAQKKDKEYRKLCPD